MKLFGRTLPASPFHQLQPTQQRWIITAIVLLVTLAIAHQGVVQPLQRRRAELDARLAAAEQRITLLRTIEATSQELAENRRRLRGRSDAASLLQDIATVATAQDVLVNAAAPQPTRPVGRYARLPIRVDVTGTFPAILHFLHALETAPKPLVVELVDLAPQNAVAWADKTSSRTLEAHLTVSALLLESPTQ